MSKKRMLFIASLPNDKFNFDGERNKSKDVLEILKSANEYQIQVIDYTKNKYLQTIKMLFLYFFKYFNCVFISKCFSGGSFALHLLNKIKHKKSKFFFYIIGNGYEGLEKKKLYFEDCNKCNAIIVESNIVVSQMMGKGVKNELMFVFPSVKPVYDINLLKKTYENEQPLKCIFFSRITPAKGLYDAVNAVIDVNNNFGKIAFTLDIAGGSTRNKEELELENYIIECERKYDFIHFFGNSFMINGIDSYLRLQKYDLHIFPSKFIFECAPGSIMDMFIAGVPTLSSRFPSSSLLLSDNDSYFFEQMNYADLVEKLKYVYLHSFELSQKRINTFELHFKYDKNSFFDFLRKIGVFNK